ncbi:MAG TPA: DNA polymerase III subunit alpha [Nitrospiria bacterium]
MTTQQDFVHLHLHTQYSLLDGANRVDRLIDQAHQMGMSSIAMTDHGNLFGAIDFYQKAKKAGINPIIGCEAYVAPKSRFDRDAHQPPFHLILLSTNLTGYKNLIKLISAAHLEGFYYKPRIDKELLSEHHEGLIGLSGCLRGEVPHLLDKGYRQEAKQAADDYEQILGKGNFFFEIQGNRLPEQLKVNKELIQISNEMDLPLVVTNDCHYLHKEDCRAHDILLCLQTGKTINDTNRMRFETDQLYFKSPQEMWADFCEVPEALLNTKRIAERCNLDLDLNTSHLPHYHVPKETTREALLEKLAKEGLQNRVKENSGEQKLDLNLYEQRLNDEISMINSMGYAGYFLIVWDIIHYAKENKIPVGPGRGSAAGSLVAYTLQITDIDPLRYGLIFERFLNPERISLPDIDMDFCMEKRDQVIDYVIDKFGADHVAQIITFGTMAAKASVRDVGRVLEIPYAEVDRFAKLIPNTLNITLEQALVDEPRIKEVAKTDPKFQELLDLARALEGTTRHASTHAAGIVISKEPLTEHVPLYRGTNNEVVTQYAMGDVEKIGLIKFDFLGLKTLTVIDHTLRLVNHKRKAEGETSLQLSSIPMKDKKTFSLLGKGETTGVFQLESSGMRDILVKMKPESFEDIIAIIALYRPGPIGSGMIDDFIKRKRGKTKIQYEVPQLEEILKETYGVIVYQEQVMKIANLLAGFSLGEADLLRRAMGKKKPEEMEKMKTQFLMGAKSKGLKPKKAEKIFDLMAYFAGYGFNKSHSAAYAMISYHTAFLKAHYPMEFMAALLTCDMGNSDKVVKNINECRAMGIRILPPDVNESQRDFTVTKKEIRFGLAAVKNVGTAAIDSILSVRDQDGGFVSLSHFCRQVDLRRVNKRVIEGLIKCGAFDSTGGKRAHLMEIMEKTIEEGGKFQEEKERGQMSIFGGPSPLPPRDFSNAQGSQLEEWDDATLLRYEKEILGFYITGHPLAERKDEIKRLASHAMEQLGDLRDGSEVRLVGILIHRKIATTKKGDKMAYVRLEDLTGSLEVIVFPDLYKTCSDVLTTDAPLLVVGNLDNGEKGLRLKATKLDSLNKIKTRLASKVEIQINADQTQSQDLQNLKNILSKYRGGCDVFLKFSSTHQGESVIAIPSDLRVTPTPLFISEIEGSFGKGTVLIK